MVRPITDDEIAVYREQGVVKLPGYVDRAQVDEILAALDHRLAHPGRWAFKGDFATDRCFALETPVLRDYVLDPVMGENAARAMGSDSAHFFFDHLFAFEPNHPIEGHYWHQDVPFWPVEGDDIVSIWLTLHDCTPESAALKFVAGSHRETKFYRPLGFDGRAIGYDLGDRAELAIDADDRFHDGDPPAFHDAPDAHGVLEFSYEAGDAVMFNTRTLHSSGGNSSPTDRRVAYSIRYFGEDARMMLRQGVFQDPALLPDDDELFEVGAPMRSRRWPLVFGG